MADLSDDIRTFVQGGIDPVTFEEVRERHRAPKRSRARTTARVLSVAVVVAVAVPVVLAVSTARTKTPTADAHNGLARHRVLAALDTTIASGSFDITFSQQPLTTATSSTTSTTTCNDVGIVEQGTVPYGSITATTGASGPADTGTVPPAGGEVCVGSGSSASGLAISGQGTVDVNPFAMVVQTQVPGLGEITLRDNGTDVWELGGGDYGLSPGSDDSGPGNTLPGFAGLVEGTLGDREGASDMMVLANPTGYLELDEDAISSADQIGTGTVDGVPVTVYQVTLNPAQEASVTGANADETSAIDSALKLLTQEGYTGTTTKISIDADGYIRQTVSTATFSDGSSQTGETTFSDFGCAGTVLMPDQSGSSTPTAGCVSPDTAGATAPSTTSTGSAGTPAQ